MKVLSNLTIKNLKVNKSRTIVTIIGIVLSTAMLVCICALTSTVLSTYEAAIIELEGDCHVSFSGVPADDVNQIALHKQVEKTYITEKRSDLTCPTANGVEIWAFDENALKENESMIIKGRLPQDESEILVGKSPAFKNTNIGDELTLSDGKNYKVVGEISYPKQMFDYSALIMFMSEPKNKVEIAVKLKDLDNIEEFIYSVVGGEKRYNVSTNYLLLTAQDFIAMANYSDDSMMFYVLLFNAVFLLLLVSVVVGAFCIRNSFAISINEKIRQYAMLASVGASRKQIRRNILFESLILGVIAIPVGVIIGALSAFVLTKLVAIFFSSMLEIVFCITPWAAIFAILLSSFTIFLSSITVAARVSKTCEIDAIRNTNEIKITRRNTKTPKIIEELFGIGGVFAFKNIKRNKRKFRVTTITLVVSIVAFITVSYSLNFFYDKQMNDYLNNDFDISVSGDDLSRAVDYIVSLDSIEDYTITYLAQKSIRPDDRKFDYKEINVIALNQASYDKYLQDNSIIYDENKLIVFDEIQIWGENSNRITVNYLDYIGQKDCFEIAGISKSADEAAFEYVKPTKFPAGVSSYMKDKICVIMSESQFEKYIHYDFETNTAYNLSGVYMNLHLKTNYVYATQNSIDEYAYKNFLQCYAKNHIEAKQNVESIYLLIKIASYLFIAIIILVGLTNIYNSLSANISLRRKEFAMLQSIGMTSKEFNKMISFECVFYVLKSLLIGVPIALAFTFSIFTSAINGDTSYTYNFPIMQIISCAVVVFFVVYGIMKSSLNKIAKQNVIETIRRENV